MAVVDAIADPAFPSYHDMPAVCKIALFIALKEEKQRRQEQ